MVYVAEVWHNLAILCVSAWAIHPPHFLGYALTDAASAAKSQGPYFRKITPSTLAPA